MYSRFLSQVWTPKYHWAISTHSSGLCFLSAALSSLELTERRGACPNLEARNWFAIWRICSFVALWSGLELRGLTAGGGDTQEVVSSLVSSMVSSSLYRGVTVSVTVGVTESVTVGVTVLVTVTESVTVTVSVTVSSGRCTT